MKKRHPEVTEFFGDFKFRGQGQKKTPVADLRSAVELTFLLPGRHAARIRRQAAELLCRYEGGDLALVEVCRNRGFQKEKNPGPEKRQFLVYLNIKKFNCFVAGTPEHFCWILGRLGFDSFLKGSTPILSQAKTRKMRISRVAHVAERYFSPGKLRKI